MFQIPWSVVFVALCSQLAWGAPYNDENAAWNVNFNRDGSDPSRYYGEWPGHTYQASPSDWREVPMYQFITDRWRDGDPRNNEGKYGGYNLYNVDTRHGGDFRGIKETLPYIKSLGFDAIWISPVFQNRNNSYHGYGQIDFTVLDDRFGTLAEFREMVDEAHRLNMYVIVDIVVNHLENYYYFEGHENGGAPFRLHDGEYRLHLRNPHERYADFREDNRFFNDGNYSDVYGYDGYKKSDSWGSGSFWFSDFHHNGDLQNWDDPWHNHLGKIFGGLDDLRTTHPRVQDKIIAMTKALISSADIDGIRMDTPMQVPLYFFKRWVPAVKAHARSLGKHNFFIFGEYYCPRERSATMVGRGKTPDQWGNPFAHIDGEYTMDAGINYDFYFKFVGPAIKAQQGGVSNAYREFKEDLRAYDFYNPDRRATNYVMLNFINNHDQWRLNWEGDGFQKTRLGNAIIAFWPGIPLFYYGDEQMFSTPGGGIGGDSREDFMTSKAWFDRPSRSSTNPAVFDNFNMTHSHYLFVQRLMNIRKQYFALRSTDEIYERWIQSNNENGIFAYTRVWGENRNWVLVAFNTWKEKLEAGGRLGKLYTGWNQGDRVVNVLNASERYTLGENGEMPSLWVEGYETKVFVREDNLQSLNPMVEEISPGHDSVVSSGTRDIVLKFTEVMKSESLKGAVLYDEQEVSAERMRLAHDGRSLRFSAEIKPGVHKIRVRKSATASDGKALFSDFVSRFRSGEALNPLVTLQKDALEDGSLVMPGEWVGEGRRKFVLQHKAEGAKQFRFSTSHGNGWSAWENYAPRTEHVGISTGNRLDVLVQYWADGSAAYFVRGSGE